MDTFRQNLIKVVSRAFMASKNIGYVGHTLLATSLVALPVVVQAATYDTYVIHTYGGEHYYLRCVSS